MDRCTQYLSPLGPLLLTSDGEALTGLWIEGQPAPRETIPEDPELPLFRQTKSWLDAYFGGLAPDPAELPLAPAGSPFRQQVWSLLLEIPWGETRSYGEIAREIARAHREKPNVRSGRRRCRGEQSHRHYHTLSPDHRHQWRADRLCRRAGQEDLAPGPRGSQDPEGSSDITGKAGRFCARLSVSLCGKPPSFFSTCRWRRR